MKNFGPVSLRRFRVLGLGSFVAAALTVSALLLTGTASAASAAATRSVPPLSDAPEHTTEIWVDVEGADARASITHIALQQVPGGWNDLAATQTPFGASAVFSAKPGAVDIRFRVSAPTVADIAVTYVAADGTVLAERLLLRTSLTQKITDADGWISWSALSEQTGGDPDAPDGPDDARDPLARSGADVPPLALVFIPVALVAVGVVLLIGARHCARKRQLTDQIESEA